jgi:hypothetical protein
MSRVAPECHRPVEGPAPVGDAAVGKRRLIVASDLMAVANRSVARVWRFIARSARRGFVGPSNDDGLARRVAFRNSSIRELDGGED